MARRFTIEDGRAPNLVLLMLATLNALRGIGGSGTIQELDEAVIEQEGVTEAEQAILMPNDHRVKLNYYLAWARTYLKRGGAIENSSRGVWALTETGEQLHSETDMQKIYDKIQLEERERARERKQSKSDQTEAEPVVIEGFPESENSTAQTWQDELLETLSNMEPSAFERLSQRLLREAGFIKVEVRGKTGDGGIDGVGVLRVNLVSFQIYFQCKKWKSSVGAKDIRDFRGALQGRADKGLFITTGTFTSQASEEATRDGAIAIDLIDGQRLCELLKIYELGVHTEMIERVCISSEWFAGV